MQLALIMNLRSTYGDLPKKTKTLLFVSFFFIITLPVFVWGLISNKFLIPQKAQSLSIGQKTSKVLVIDFNPTLSDGKTLSVDRNWSDPQTLETQYSQKLSQLSNSYANFQIENRVTVNAFPQLADGFTYTESTYLSCLTNNSNCHQPTMVDYLKILNDYHVCDMVNSGQIDELWLWGGPWFGYWEAVMAGPTAFNTNAPPISGSKCTKNLNIMGFSYERGLPEMLEDFGHRFEGTMTNVFTNKGINLWTNFEKNNRNAPGSANCGTVHIPPNGTTDYDWSNTAQVSNNCEDWLNYPNLTGTTQTFGCEKWGCTDEGWKEYWLGHIPKAPSSTNGTWDNWWKYVLDYDNATAPLPTPTPSPTPWANCNINYPFVRASSPSNQSGAPGTTLTYTILITNEDNGAGCGTENYILTPKLPLADWSASLSTNSISLTAGQTGTIQAQFTSSLTTAAGIYPVSVTAIGFHTTTGGGVYQVVNSTPTPTPTITPSPSPSPNPTASPTASPTLTPSPSPTGSSSPTPIVCNIADINKDGTVDSTDRTILLANFFTSGPVGDLNGDAIVDGTDYSILVANFGKTTGICQ